MSGPAANKRALIAMSGGVDSAVAALLMLRAGYACVGVTMKLFDDPGAEPSSLGAGQGWPGAEPGSPGSVPAAAGRRGGDCCSLEDAEDARYVAHALGIPHYVFNFAAGFREQVVGRFVRAYQEGLTPNPCIDCNRYIKFDQLLRRAEALAFDRVATGHYARTEADGGSGRRLLRKAADSAKDQSYVLYMLSQSQLARIRFPLGEMRKAQVRELAAQAGFINAGKRESQDICFVRDGDYGAFIDRYTGVPAPAGDFVDGAGAPLGEHRGLTRYTVGQRKGLGLALGEPLYVCDKDAGTNTVRLGRESELYNRELLAAGLNLIAVERLERPRRVRAKIRYRQAEQPALAEQLDGDTLRVVFDQPQRAIAKGQAVVLYEDDIVLGGGTIV